jgi:hypothetical protein
LLTAFDLTKLAAGKPLEAYKVPEKQAILVALGRRNGAGSLFGMVIGAKIGSIKTKDLFVPKWWKDMHATQPK